MTTTRTAKKRTYRAVKGISDGALVSTRLNKEMHDWITKRAEKNRRSRAAEILHILDEAKAADK